MRSTQARIRRESETELIDDKIIAELIHLWTGKGKAGQHEALNKTPIGKHWANTLAEESADFMKEVACQMTMSDLIARLNDMRRLETLAQGFRDVIYEVRESRKRSASLAQK